MQHEQFKGTHYEIGYRFGSALAKRGTSLLRNAPFPLTRERRAFALACLPAYEEFFPEILEEIRGLADGQQCGADSLQALLFGMYALPPACGCSCFAISDGAHILLGRNSDFLAALEDFNANFLYQFTGSGSFSFTGNSTAFLEMEDGVNQHGLAVGLTSVPSPAAKPGMNAGMLLRFFLEKCRDTEEVIYAVRHLPIASAQTFTVADANGSIAVAECCPGKQAAIRPNGKRPFVCAANGFRTKEMAPFQDMEADNWQSAERFQTLEGALLQCGGKMDVPAAQALLSGRKGFLCQYDRAEGMDTMWSVVYDLEGKTISRAEGNPAHTPFETDTRFRF